MVPEVLILPGVGVAETICPVICHSGQRARQLHFYRQEDVNEQRPSDVRGAGCNGGIGSKPAPLDWHKAGI
jgi:hypothetical protein